MKKYEFVYIKRKNPVEFIANSSFILAMVVVIGYFSLTVKAVMVHQKQFKENYRVGRIEKEQYDQLMAETTCLKLLLSPDKVIKTLFH
jgi:hypothetical protein